MARTEAERLPAPLRLTLLLTWLTRTIAHSAVALGHSLDAPEPLALSSRTQER